jgi:hypothetical protein
MVLVVVVTVVAAGCVEYREVGNTWDKWKSELPRQSKGQDQKPGSTVSTTSTFDQPTWAIELTSFTGKKQTAQAHRYAKDLHRKTNMPGLWVESDSDKTYVYRGRYLDPGGIGGKSDLRQTRMIQIDNTLQFKNAKIVRVDERHADIKHGSGVTRAMSLKHYSGRDLYSLQVGVYDELYGKNFREACELRVAQLNKLGEQAYFYHSAHQSMVTIGLYTHDIAFTPVRVQMPGSTTPVWQDQYSPLIRDLQKKKFPHNIYNGQSDPTDESGASTRLDTSSLVRVP